MKYRIIQRGDGKFQVQYKHSRNDWRHVEVHHFDYPYDLDNWRESSHYDDYLERVYSSLELAQAKLNKIIEATKKEELKKKITVIEEVSV